MAVTVKGKIKKWGNSFGVIIPKEVIDSENFKEDQEIEYIILPDREKSKKIFEETFGILKGKLKKSTEKMMRETDRELYPEDYE